MFDVGRAPIVSPQVALEEVKIKVER